ncbi:MAG: NAD(P)/FAD-dependent oxidoreductase [Thermodesulfobacteriota bacterium]
MTAYDVIIAGGGPAGAAAAAVMAGAGARVLVLDRAVFPREKLCAGLLTWKTVRTLDRVFGEKPETLMARGVINHVSARYRIRHRETELSGGGLVYPFHFVERRVFDTWCLDRAQRAGADVRMGEGVSRADPESATVWTSRGLEYSGKYLIGADGASSAVRSSCGFDKAAWRAGQGMGLEVYLPRDWLNGREGLHEDVLADFPTIYSGFIDAGYSWTFPHRDRVIVGICGLYMNRPAGMIREKLDDFLRFLGLPEDHGLQVKGHPLPYGNWLRRPARGKALLAGDAGGLVEPFFGEGIHYALRTGELAAEACLNALSEGTDPVDAYVRALEREIFPELTWAKHLRNVLYWFVRSGMVLPVRLFLGGGGTRLQEMVHGMRSFRMLRKLG